MLGHKTEETAKEITSETCGPVFQEISVTGNLEDNVLRIAIL